MTVGGLEIDLVQLRSEEYADAGANGSRIPTSVVSGLSIGIDCRMLKHSC